MKYQSLVLPLVLALLIFSCKKDDGGTTPQGGITVSGIVTAFGGAPVANATIQLFAGNTSTGTPAATATSNTSGQWQASVSSAGRYTGVISASGYPTSYVSINIQSGQTTVNVGTTILAAQRISGIINDARTATPIPNAVVRFFLGTGTDTTGYRFPDLVTNSLGQFTTTLAIGSYVYVVYAPLRLTLVTQLSVTDTAATQITATVTDPVPAGQMRIVLNWGRLPSDLDSHLTGDSTTTAGRPRYHVFYANRVVRLANGDTIAYLDVDDVTSYGPETITIYRFFPGTLR
ncbi:MAG TPA: carboxypeptidase regulatory-like domain-containing protein, partial [Bacteroidota bacterium]|nr:carboxypeptidase regulatory-like domain-containing protein [Bacteroidota bacterium]